MTEADRFELLRDLARLIKKYGPDAFVGLSDFFKSPDAIDQLVTILDAGATAGQKARVTKASGTPKRAQKWLDEILFEIEKTEPDKAQELFRFVQAFRGKRALPTIRNVRDFALDNGLRPVTATNRNKALLPLVKDLVAHPTGELLTILKTVTVHEREGDRTLEGWTGVILDKERRNR